MPKRIPKDRHSRDSARYWLFLALLSVRPACREDLLLLAGRRGWGGLTVAAWAQRWGLPSWCAELGKTWLRQRAGSPRLNLLGPAVGFILPAPTAEPFRFEAPGWDWNAGEQCQDAAGRLRAAFELALQAHLAEREQALEAAGWAPYRREALVWLARRVVPEALGGATETALNIGEDFGVDESTVSRATAELARELDLTIPGGNWTATRA